MINESDSFVFNDEEQKVFDSLCDLHEQLDDILARTENEIPPSRERSLVITKIQEADMWLARIRFLICISLDASPKSKD